MNMSNLLNAALAGACCASPCVAHTGPANTRAHVAASFGSRNSLTSFIRRDNPACNAPPGSQMWFVKLSGPTGAKVVYKESVNGIVGEQTKTVSLVNMPGLTERSLFCSRHGGRSYSPVLVSETAR